MALYVATFLVAPGGPLVDREIEADDIGDAWHRAQLMPRRPGLLQDVREAWKPETDAELAARLVTKRDERIKGLSANLEEKEAEVERLRSRVAELEAEKSEFMKIVKERDDLIDFRQTLRWQLKTVSDENAGLRAAQNKTKRHLLDEIHRRDEKVSRLWEALEPFGNAYAAMADLDPKGWVTIPAYRCIEARAALGSPTQSSPDRCSELEGAIRDIVEEYNDFMAVYSDTDVATLLKLGATVRAIGRAEAALGGEPSGYVVVPSDTLDWIFRSLCAYLDYFGVDSRCYDPKEAVEATRPYTSLGNPSETPISSEE